MNYQFAAKLSNITKIFGEFKANDSVNFNVIKGEIHALVGENGAGKSTLMNILYGMYHPDEGRISINGNETVIDSPGKAISLGIGMVHQHFMLAGNLTVLENIILGDETAGIFGNIKYKECAQKISELLKSFNIEIDMTARTDSLAVGIQQKIEIIKVLYRNADILILDEPTAVLTPQETDELFRTLKKLKDSGKTIILITHKLAEVLAVSDRVTILRHGKVTGELETKNTTNSELSNYIIGEGLPVIEGKPQIVPGDVILSVKKLSVLNNKNIEALRNISFEIKAGEIFGIAGVEGNGQTELIEAVCGLCEYSGSIYLNDKKLTENSQIAHIPADRHRDGIVMEYSVAENILLGRESEQKFSSSLFLKQREIKEYSQKLINEYDVRPADAGANITGLSGGNQQKVVAARELTKDTDLIVVSHPTRGLDIKASNFVHNELLKQSNKGKAILLVSSDINELLKLSTRIAVMYNGEISVVLLPEDTNEREIGAYMMGIATNNE